jgi:osmotically-inducible protein OsmY
MSASYSYGLSQRAVHVRERRKPDMDDITIARKVETELFRGAKVPKGQINVNVENGIVYLRGEVETQELMDRLERKARKVHEAKRVENLMHLPGQPAPTHV